MSLQRESVALENGQPIAHQAHTNELEVTPNESPIGPTSHALFEELRADVGHLQIHINQLNTDLLEARIDLLHTIIAQLPTRTGQMQARVDQFLNRIDQLQTRVGQLQVRIDRFPTRIDQLQTHINQFTIDFERVRARVDRLPTRIHQLLARGEQLQQELFASQEIRPPTRHDESNAQNASLHIRKAAVEDLLLSVDGSWENIDPCFCSDSYALMTAAGKCHAPAKMPKCGHVFGRACIALWLQEKNTCPMCRDRVRLPRV